MTSPLRRKRPTTAPARNTTPARTALSLAGLLLWAGLAPAQPPDPPPPQPAAKAQRAKPHDQFADEHGPVQPAQAYGQPGAADVSAGEYGGLVEPPSPEALFKLESESEFFVRLQQEHRDQGYKDRLVFPDEPVISREKYLGRSWPEYAMTVEPDLVCYKRLMFEQKNYERYGWDMGELDMPLSAGAFFLDVILLPYNAFTDPFRTFECNAGYCLPGDPVPLLAYPPEVSATGALAEAGAAVAVFAIFP